MDELFPTRDELEVELREERKATGVCPVCGTNAAHASEPAESVPAPRAAPAARSDDPDTSKAAAASVRNINKTHRSILTALRVKGPMNDEELYRYLTADRTPHRISISPSGCRSRRAELVDAGKIEWSGAISRTVSGRKTRVWKLTEKTGVPAGG